MPKPLSPSRFPLLGRAHDAVQAFLRLMSFYGVPIAIGIFSVIALLFWDSQYVSSGERPVMLRVVAESGTALNPRAALGRLDAITPVTTYDTRLSQAPVWFSLNSRSNGSDQPVIEFPSRHALAIACWDADTLQALGSSSRSHSEGALAPVKAGFALRLAQHQERVLCRASFAGPARLTALQWPAAQLAQSEIQFHRKSGLLDGGMVVLALFVFITALINRQRLYVLFAGWLVINLRVGALSGGWDTQWLGQIVPPEWLLLTRSVSIALVSITTLTLYLTLFRDEIAKTRYMTPLRVVEWLCLPLLVASVVLPYNTFLPLMWPIVGGGLTLMTLGLFTIMFQSSNRVAIWFTASFMVTFVSGLSELVAAALGIRELMGLVNSVTAALTSSLLAALAVAEQMRIETMQRIAAQAELEHTYEAMPVGLFTLDGQGGFLSANPAMHIMLNAEVLPGRARFKDYFPERVWAQLDELVHQHAAAELAIQNHDGSRHFLVRATLARGKIEGVLQDTTEQTKATQQLEFLANHDPLTKVYNRRGIEVAFEEATAAAGSEPVALAYLDLDRFKLINDMFGHTAGDEVLQQVCERINSVLSGGRHIGRVGGDEFVMVMPDTTVALATLICRGVIDRIGNTPFRVADKAFHVRGSIGLIEITPGMPIKDAISTADRACREAKAGNDGLVTYERDAAAFHEREAELTLLAQLSGTEATARMFIEMQPIMSLQDPYESLNFEVLLRMRETDGRVTAAAPIVAAAEKSGRASVIDRWVLSTTLGWIEKNA
ncbi:MAG: diguanylate cyclase domain-containing protein [Gammaproteobacteria bacterium]